MKPDVEIVVENTAGPVEEAFQSYFPIQWEQERHRVWHAMVVHRWAALKVRQLSRRQYAINWATMPGTQLWRWSRLVGSRVFGLLRFLYPRPWA